MPTREEEVKKHLEKRARKAKHKESARITTEQPPHPPSNRKFEASLPSLLWRYAVSKKWWPVVIFSILLAAFVGNWMEKEKYEAPDIFLVPAFVFGGIQILYLLTCVIIILVRGSKQIEADIISLKENKDNDDDRMTREEEFSERIEREHDYRRTHDQDFGHTH